MSEKKQPTSNVALKLGGIIILLVAIIAIIYMATPSGPCSEFKDKYERQLCVADHAIGNQSVVMCNDVTNIDLKEYCISSIAVETGAPKLCELLTNQTHGSCITDIALARNEPVLCDTLRFVDERWLDVCQMQISIKMNNTDRCSSIGFADLRDNCIVELQKTRNDFELCKKIVTDSTRHRCMRDIALLEKDVDRCRSIQDGFYRDSQCRKKLAQLEGNRDYCDLITIIQIRINCYERVLDLVLVDSETNTLTNFHLVAEHDLDIPDNYLPPEFRTGNTE